jgi:mono/diheme cytochrome c family protein
MKRALLFLLWLPMTGWGDESQIRLKEGPGKDLVAANCAICHSLDYIPMNSPFLDAPGWEKEVNKMVNLMGAPIRQDDILAILNYLNANYGANR